MADIAKAIGANDIKNGSSISGVSMRGDVQSYFQDQDSNTPDLSDLEDKYGSRFDDPKYYGGQNSLLTGLVAWYKLNEITGVRRSSIGDGIDLTDNNTVGSTTDDFVTSGGMIESGGHFKKLSNEYLSMDADAADAFDINGSFSISLWFNLATTTSNADMIRMWDTAITHKFKIMWRASSFKSLRFYTSNASATDTYIESTGSWAPSTPVGTWQHVLAIYDDDAGTKSLYINNTDLVQSSGETLRGSVDSGLQISAASNTVSGSMDEIGFWSKALSSDERSSLYNSGNGITYPGF